MNKYLMLLFVGLMACQPSANKQDTTGSKQDPFPYTVTEDTKNRQLSAAMERSFNRYSAIHPRNNELYSLFKYTDLEGFDYSNHDGTISRRDPSKVIFENGKYYVWYTKRDTPVIPVGASNADQSNDTIPSTDWDLAEIWYATSEDGFHWEEQGVAVPRPPKPEVGWRSVSTADILKWKGKFYLYYQGFMEASGKRGDYCPVTVSYADSPDGPWTPVGKIVIENGPEGSWDQYAIHDPYPLVHDGKIYIYYKSAFNRPDPVWVGGGLVTGTDPLGPFDKHPLNPLTSSGHEVTMFPFKEGLGAIVAKDGTEHFTIQYAEDWVNFEIASITELIPVATGPFVPDAFTDTDYGRGITWGLSHFVNAGTYGVNPHSILTRFDCDLSLDVDDPRMKETGIRHDLDVYFRQGLSKDQRVRIEEQTEKLRKE
ncbi:hypothetical protein GCM10028791_16300 [Echinicola sediminis]